MKKILYIALLATGLISGCQKVEDPILDDPDTRLTAALAADEAILSGAANGWRADIYPAGGKGFSYYFKFNDGKVTMMSDFNNTTATTPKESTYRLKALQRPTLIFDTYSYVHLPADPNASISGGTQGQGLKSDFEFAIIETSANTIKLEGTVNKCAMTLTKLTATEETAIKAGKIKTFMDDAAASVTGKFLYVVIDGKQVPLTLSIVNKSVGLTYVNTANQIAQTSTNFSFSLDGLNLKAPLVYNGVSYTKVYWDDVAKMFYLMNGATKINSQVSLAPIALDVTPPLLTAAGSQYSTLLINVANLGDLSASFLTAYNTANASLGTYQSNAGRYIEYITILFNPAGTQMTFQIRYRNPAAPTSFFLADFIYNKSVDANGVITFTLAAAPAGNAATINPYVTALTTYFSSNKWKLAYIAASAPAGSTIGAFISTTTPGAYFYGVLGF